MLRELCGVSVIGVLGWMMVGGVSGYSRVVDKSPTDVAAAIADLDIRHAPGSPGTDAMASGGELPTFSVESAPDHVTYIVMAHGQVATRMTAWLEPIDGGKRTRVTASVDRGSAPDDYVSPAFRSTGITMGLFTAMLEDQLDSLVFKIGPWGPHCDAVMARFENGEMQPPPQTITQGIAQTARLTMSLGQLDKELKAAGCPPNANGDAPRDRDGFTPVRSQLSDSPSPSEPPFDPRIATKPATDLGRYR